MNGRSFHKERSRNDAALTNPLANMGFGTIGTLERIFYPPYVRAQARIYARGSSFHRSIVPIPPLWVLPSMSLAGRGVPRIQLAEGDLNAQMKGPLEARHA